MSGDKRKKGSLYDKAEAQGQRKAKKMRRGPADRLGLNSSHVGVYNTRVNDSLNRHDFELQKQSEASDMATRIAQEALKLSRRIEKQLTDAVSVLNLQVRHMQQELTRLSGNGIDAARGESESTIPLFHQRNRVTLLLDIYILTRLFVFAHYFSPHHTRHMQMKMMPIESANSCTAAAVVAAAVAVARTVAVLAQTRV